MVSRRPIFNYPYERTRLALYTAARSTAPDDHWGHTLRFANPLNGEWATPSIANWMTYLPPDFAVAPMRSTDALIICVAEGSGTVDTGFDRFAFGPRDIFVIPNWTRRRFAAGSDGCVLFAASDRAAQEKLGLWREEWLKG